MKLNDKEKRILIKSLIGSNKRMEARIEDNNVLIKKLQPPEETVESWVNEPRELKA